MVREESVTFFVAIQILPWTVDRRSSTAASRMSCSNGRCSSSSTAACQVMGVIDLLLEQQNTRRRRTVDHFPGFFTISRHGIN